MPVDRRLTFYAWANTNENHPFDRLKAAAAVGALGKTNIVLEHGDDELTALEVVSQGNDNAPTKLLVHALHGPGSRPSEYGPGEGTRTIQIGKGRYTAFTGHMSIWPDKIAAIDMHGNCPGLGRVAVYLRRQANQRVVFRPLYNQAAADRLKDLDGMRGVDFAIHDPHKVSQAQKRGMLRSILPSRRFPSISVSAGMSRKQPKDSYIETEVENELMELADSAEQFFDRLIVRGLSKTQKTKTGKKKSIRVNLLSERLHIERSLASDEANPSLPTQGAVFDAIAKARKALEKSNQLEDAVEARLSLDEE